MYFKNLKRSQQKKLLQRTGFQSPEEIQLIKLLSRAVDPHSFYADPDPDLAVFLIRIQVQVQVQVQLNQI